MNFSKPIITIDLAEYTHLKSIEAKKAEVIDGISADELSEAVCIMMRSASRSGDFNLAVLEVKNRLKITVVHNLNSSNAEGPKIYFKKIK